MRNHWIKAAVVPTGRATIEPLLLVANERTQFEIENLCKFSQGEQRDVELAAFKSADVGTVHVRCVRQSLLRDPLRPSSFS